MKEETKKNTMRHISENGYNNSTCQNGIRHLLVEMNFHVFQLTEQTSKQNLFYLWTGNRFKTNHSCALSKDLGISLRKLAPSYEFFNRRKIIYKVFIKRLHN